jgi:hypothetical protein
VSFLSSLKAAAFLEGTRQGDDY